MTTKNFSKYKQNLRKVYNNDGMFIQSYDTIVAKVDFQSGVLWELGYWSKTTKKHINYAAKELNLKIEKQY
jgi:nucleoside 2-deoxyribosyltransferase